MKRLGFLFFVLLLFAFQANSETVLTIFFEVSDLGFDYLQAMPSMTKPSIKANIKTAPSPDFAILYLEPVDETIIINTTNVTVGRTDSILVAYPEQDRTVIQMISGSAKIPILLPKASEATSITGAKITKGQIVCQMSVDADPTKILDLKLQFGNGRVAEPTLFLTGSSSCASVQRTNQSGELIYQVIPSNCPSLDIFSLYAPTLSSNTTQVDQNGIIIGKPDILYRYNLPIEKPRLVAKAAHFQRITGKQYGDFNQDGLKSSKDLQAVVKVFGQKDSFIWEDVNDDGIVNVLDLATIAQKIVGSSAAPPKFTGGISATTWGKIKQ